MSLGDAPQPRLCHLRKWPDFESYGFNLHADMGKAGQYVGSIDKNSPAEAGGLLSGDVIVEVNGVNISNEYHTQVVERIKSEPGEVRLLVITPEGEEYYNKLNVIVNGNMDGIIHCETPSTNPFGSAVVHLDEKYHLRVCKIHLWPDFSGYGFNVQGLEGKPGHFVGAIDVNSPAHYAGLKENDRILEVNHQDVTSKLHKVVVDLIRSGRNGVDLLVVDPETESYLTQKGITLPSNLPCVVECKGLPTNPKTPVISINEDSVDAVQASPEFNSRHHHHRTTSNGSIVLDHQLQMLNGHHQQQQQRGVSPTPSEKALKLARSAKEARERMAKKKNVKDSGLSIMDKFQILQKL